MLDGVPIIGLSPNRLSRSSLLLKRTMDLVLSGLGLVLLAPVFALIALRIKLDSTGPVFYRHDRIGQNRRPFRLLKFRTMQANYCRGPKYGGEIAEQEFKRLMQDPERREEFETNHKLRSDPRVTSFGSFLRRKSLDELPQLVNVLRGELSLVGPRPIVADELNRYGEDVDTLLALRPGLTGYWQVSGRSDSTYEERVRLDVAYSSNWSLQLDLSILAHTLRLLVKSPRGAY
jgi:lipopolysaccharide/colanic/teichoic acid biosynthesis glycosyltransferase